MIYLITYILIGLVGTIGYAIYYYIGIKDWEELKDAVNLAVEESNYGNSCFSASEAERNAIIGLIVMPILWPFYIYVYLKMVYRMFKK